MLKGKGIWINVIKECDGGDVQKIANKCVQAGISYALIKAIEGKSGFNFSGDIDLVKVLAKALREKGIEVVAWGAVYGDSFGTGYWKDEVGRVVRRMNDELVDIDWFILDIESRWRDQHGVAEKFMNELLASLRLDCKLGFSSFRYPKQHSTIPYDAFLTGVHVNIPQVYWVGAQNSVDQLRECIKQYSDIGYAPEHIPMAPAAPAYHRRDKNWETTPRALQQFFAEVIDQGFESCTFWDYKHARSTGLWSVIGELEFPTDPELPDPPVDPHMHPGIKENESQISLLWDHVEGNGKSSNKNFDLIEEIQVESKRMKGEQDAYADRTMELEINQSVLIERVRKLEWKLSFWKWLARLLRIAPEDAE